MTLATLGETVASLLATGRDANGPLGTI